MANDDGSLIRMEGIHKWFGPNHVLRGIDVELNQRDVLVIIGPSGSGKSTLLRCTNLLELPTMGKVWFEVPSALPAGFFAVTLTRIEEPKSFAWMR